MTGKKQFIDSINKEFPEGRLTFQKSTPTFHPESVEEAARLFGMANKSRQKLYISGFGNIIQPVGEKFENIIAVKSDRLNNLIKITTTDYYVVVGAGYPLRELNLDLKKHDLFLPHSDLPYAGSVGGALATGLTADYKGQALPINKYLIMATIANPRGEIINPGSVCFKSASGFDIIKIFSPSWGLLGMFVDVTFRVMPISGKEDYGNLVMCPIEYKEFTRDYTNPADNVSAQYSIKIKNKFDPNNILPLVDI